MVFSRPVLMAWVAALLAAFLLNRLSPAGRPLGSALTLLLQSIFLLAFAVRLWRVGPRPLAVGAALLLLLYAALDQFALAFGWW